MKNTIASYIKNNIEELLEKHTRVTLEVERDYDVSDYKARGEIYWNMLMEEMLRESCEIFDYPFPKDDAGKDILFDVLDTALEYTPVVIAEKSRLCSDPTKQ